MSASENPCLGCPASCCRFLKRLKLSKPEYDRLFAPFRDRFSVKKKNGLMELTMNEGEPCPHLRDEACSQYEIRPMECRLFPYTANHVYHLGPFTILTFHSRVPCPLKKKLVPSQATARGLILPFAREVYGKARRFVILHEGPLYRLISRLQIKKLFRR